MLEMLRQMTMKWKLTLHMGAVLLILGVILSAILLTIGQETNDLFLRARKDRALAIAESLKSELAARVTDGSLGNAGPTLARFAGSHPGVYAVAVLGKSGSVELRQGKDLDIEGMVEGLDLEKVNENLIGDFLVVTTPIAGGGNSPSVGCLVYVESIEAYFAARNSAIGWAFGSTLGCFLLLMLAAYFIGSQTASPLLDLVATAERIADGDLRNVEAEAAGSVETVRLASSVQSMGAALQNQVAAIKRLTADISSSSREVAGTMTHLASSASEQAAAVTETAATVEELEQAGKNVAGNASQIVDAAGKTTEASIRGREAVKTTSEIIMRIKEDSQEMADKSRKLLSSVEEVGNIIRSVNAIAEQSKILAVNASIEAAKAGEYGSGFAVVAQEVKDLAQQSKDATRQITVTLTAIRQAIETMVETSQKGKERTETGVKMIANAGAIMNDLSEAIRENSEFANMIAANIRQQTVGLTQIATSIDQINSTALENQNISRTISLSTSQMIETFDLLSKMVGKWQTPDPLSADSDAGSAEKA